MRVGGVMMLASLAAAVLCGCDASSRRASARLRTENASLMDQVAALEARQRELEATVLASAEHPTDGTISVEMPQVATLEVSPISGFEPGDTPESLILEVHVSAADGRQRPIQLVGELEAQVLRPVPGESPRLLADRVLSPAQVRDAWRGGLFGATYLVPIELAAADVPANAPLLIHVFHTDARTGRELEASGGVAHSASTDPT